MNHRNVLVLIAAAALAGCSAAEPERCPDGSDAQMAFARLKLLAGKWNAQLPPKAAPAAEPTTEPTPPQEQPQPPPPTPPTGGEKSENPANPEQEAGAPAAAPAAPVATEPGTETIPVEYTVTSGGHALQEKLLAGTDEEMVTIYYLEGEGLALVHYCSIGNRPHMRLDVARSTRDDLHFEWDSTATDIDPKRDAHIHNGRIHFVDADTIECEWAFWVDGKEAHRREFTLSRTSGSFTPPAK